MKVIVSHDIDHVTVWEHYNDMIVPKFVIIATTGFSIVLWHENNITEITRKNKKYFILSPFKLYWILR